MVVFLTGAVLLFFGVIVGYLGADVYEDAVAFVGGVMAVIGIILLVIGMIIPWDNEEEQTDRHIRITYEGACERADGEFTTLDGESVCIVKE